MPDPLTSALIGSLLNTLVDHALTVSPNAAPQAVPVPAGLVRALPMEAQRGWLQRLGTHEAIIDGQALRLSPATQVRGPDNLIVLPAQIGPLMTSAASLPVRYTLDAMGAVHRIWILSQAELATESGAALARTPSSAD